MPTSAHYYTGKFQLCYSSSRPRREINITSILWGDEFQLTLTTEVVRAKA